MILKIDAKIWWRANCAPNLLSCCEYQRHPDKVLPRAWNSTNGGRIRNHDAEHNALLFFCRMLWVVVVLLGLVGASFMVSNLWDRYVGTPTRTSVETNHYPTWRLPFPAVTLCNANRIFRSKAEALVSELWVMDLRQNHSSQQPNLRPFLKQEVVLSFKDEGSLACLWIFILFSPSRVFPCPCECSLKLSTWIHHLVWVTVVSLVFGHKMEYFNQLTH